jgi:hypothetical protein
MGRLLFPSTNAALKAAGNKGWPERPKKGKTLLEQRLPFFLLLIQKNSPAVKRDCTNQIPLTIKPYPMKIQIYDVQTLFGVVLNQEFYPETIKLIEVNSLLKSMNYANVCV